MHIRNIEALQAHINSSHRVKYLFFWGHQKPKNGVSASCFSQWYDAPFDDNGHHFLTAEHYMMYHKAMLFGDQAVAEQVLNASDPRAAKALGRKVSGFDNALWEQHRFEIVVNANLAKFSAHPELKEFLFGTGERILVEASPVDRIWGIGLAADSPKAENPNAWRGLNLLGFALMEVRERLQISA